MADASIYSLLRPAVAQVDPIARAGSAMQLKALMGQNELQELKTDEARQGAERGRSVRDLFAGNPNATAADVMRIDPTLGAKLREVELKGRETESTIGKNNAAAGASTAQQVERTLNNYRSQLTQINDPASAAQWLSAQYQDPVLGPLMARLSPLEQGLQRIPQDPAAFQQWRQQVGMGMEKFAEHTRGLAQQAETGRHNLATEGNTVRGQDLTARVAREGHGVTLRGQNLTDARARETAQREAFGPPQEVTGPDGRPMLVMQNRRTGQMVDANTQQPLPGTVGPKMGETAQKQQTGVQTTRDAITEYRTALKGLSALDAASPNARARMGTIYNNMLLQAKEAYNLGVLNGPDYEILQQVITNPVSWRGALTTKKALDDQAKKLDEVLSRVGTRVTQTQSGVTPATNAPADDPLGLFK